MVNMPQPQPQSAAPAPAPAGAPAPAPSAQPNDSNIEQVVLSVLDAANEQQKKFIAAHLTSEVIDVISMLTNDPDVRTVLSKYADPAVVLVPMPRDQVMKAMTSSPEATSPAAVPDAIVSEAPSEASPVSSPALRFDKEGNII